MNRMSTVPYRETSVILVEEEDIVAAQTSTTLFDKPNEAPGYLQGTRYRETRHISFVMHGERSIQTDT